MPNFAAKLLTRATLSPRVEVLTFLASEAFERAAGQYVKLILDDGSGFAFSVASPYDEQAPGRFEIAVARGTTAGALLELEPGSSVTVKGPSGALVWQEAAPTLLIATGTGISPLRAILLEQLSRGGNVPLTLLFGCRDAAEELWGAEFRRLASEHSRFRYVPVHSQPLPGHVGCVGRVQAFVPQESKALGADQRAYLCGHTPMVQECKALLVEHGVLPQRISGESY